MAEPGKGKALVTGATGFIGGNLVRALRADGFAVRALVRDPRRAAGLENVELFTGDLLQPDGLAGLERNVDVVVHCAGILGTWGTPAKLLHDVNVQGTIELLQRFRGTKLRRFVHLSAGGVTGPLRQGHADETYPCRPATPYERSKFLAECEVLELSKRNGVPVTVVRPTFTYGPGDPHKIALFRAVKRGRYVFIGGGKSFNHPAYVDDVVRGTLLALERGRDGEVYIVGGDRPVTKRELVYTIADALEVDRPRWNVPRWLALIAAWKLELLGRLFRFEPILTRSRVMMMADDFGYSIEKARKELGYSPRTSLHDGIAATVRSYRDAELL